MADLTSAALFERDGRVLVAHRRRPPFVAQWVLPMTLVGVDEAAEDALRRHARDQFGVGLGEETFVETVYLVDPDDARQYVANIFRTPLVGGPMRFNTEGDYDDARWLAPADLEQLWMPPDLRVPLVQILTSPEVLHETDWSQMHGEAAPLAEREAGTPPEPAPDNRAGWDAIAGGFQEERYGDRAAGRLKWSWSVFEDEVGVLGDVRGKRAIVLGCGGGQDCVALERMGAIAVGIDQSTKQLEYARAYAERHGARNASFVEGTVEDLSRFDDESFDLAVSIHVLGHVEEYEQALRETARVLKPGGVVAIAVQHPFHHTLASEPPFAPVRRYGEGTTDWEWTLENGTSARFRAYWRTVSQWLAALSEAGLTVERIIEPDEASGGGGVMKDVQIAKARLVPYTLIMKARKR